MECDVDEDGSGDWSKGEGVGRKRVGGVPKSMQGPLGAESERGSFRGRGREEYTCWILTHDDDPLRGFEACPPHACSFIFVPPAVFIHSIRRPTPFRRLSFIITRPIIEPIIIEIYHGERRMGTPLLFSLSSRPIPGFSPLFPSAHENKFNQQEEGVNNGGDVTWLKKFSEGRPSYVDQRF